jgi:glycosyltransferase involved in cell wall biosynthesis
MKVAIISYVNPIGHPGYWPGMERLVEGIITGLVQNDCDITLICSGKKNNFYREERYKIKIKQIKCLKIGLLGINIFDFSNKVRKLDFEKFDFILIIGCSVDLRFIKKKYKNKTISYFAHIDHIQSLRDFLFLPIINNIQFNIFKQSRGVLLGIPENSNEELAFKKFTKYLVKNTLNVKEGVESFAFPYLDRDTLNPNYVKLLYVGPLIPRKRVDVLLNGMSLLVNDFPNATLSIVGNGHLKFKLRKLSEKLNLHINVTFYGYITEEELKTIYKKSDIFVFASTKEGYPLAPLEAMSTGLPVVASSLDPLKEIVGKTGKIFQVNDFKDFYKNLIEIINDNPRNLGKLASERTKNEFNWKYITKNYIDFFSNLIDEK